MDKVLVTAICSAGVALACALVVAWRQTTVGALATPDGEEPLRDRIGEGLRLAAAVAAAGLAGGVLAFGLGGRLMMRVLAATSPDSQGFLTDAEERVGEVTIGGTIGFVVFLGIVTVVPAGAFLLERRFFPQRSLMAGLVAGGIAGGLLVRPSGLVDPGNHDFGILGPTWLAVLLCLGVVVLGSLTVAVLVDRWVAGWRQPSLTPRGFAASLPLAIYAIPPVTVVGVVLVASRVVRIRRAGRERSAAVTAAGTKILGLAGILGGAWVLFSAVEILR